MRRAMADAEVGDDVYREDPTVQRLEARVAERLGLEAAVYVPSGTQGNQGALGVHCPRGTEAVMEERSHTFHYENGAVAALWGIQPRTLIGRAGDCSPRRRSAVRCAATTSTSPAPRCWCWRTPTTGAAARCGPSAQFQEAVAVAREAGIAVHLDGARLFNAEVATKQPASAWARLTDSTTVCFSKGLGAPVGSVLCGSKAFVAEARRMRKRLGGGLRQGGILAAACLYALDHHVERLAEDHANARLLAERIAQIPGVTVELDRVETNMVYADLAVEAPPLVSRLREAGLLVNAVGSRSLRFVTHLDVSARTWRARRRSWPRCWQHSRWVWESTAPFCLDS